MTISKITSNLSKINVKPFEAIPGPKPLPFICNVWRYFPLIGDYRVDTLYENAIYNHRRYGPIVREKITPKHTVLHLFDPNDIEALFRQDGMYPHRRSHRALLKYRHDRQDLYRDGGLFPENGLNWLRQRRQFQPRMMSKRQTSLRVELFDQEAIKIVASLGDTISNASDSIKLEGFEQFLYKWALSSSLSAFLDCEIDTVKNDSINKLIEQLHNSLISTDGTEIKSDKWIESPSKCPYYKQLSESQDFLYTFVNEQIDTNLKKNLKVSFLHDWLLNDKIDRRDVVSFVIDLLMAGFHTTAYTVAHLLYHISKRDNIQEKVYREINENLEPNEPITLEKIDSLVLIKACLKEAMRLNPVSIGTGRLTQDDIIIRDYFIPKNTMIIAQTQVASSDHQIFECADSFLPERWLAYRKVERTKRPSPFANLPFGFGARSCLGQRIAELQIRVLTVRILQRYRIKYNQPIATKTTMIHNISEPIQVELNTIKSSDYR